MTRGRHVTLPGVEPLMVLDLAPTERVLIEDGAVSINREEVLCGVPGCGMEATEYIRREAACGVLVASLACDDHIEAVSLILKHQTHAEIAESVPHMRRENVAAICRRKALELVRVAAELQTMPAVTEEFLRKHMLHHSDYRSLQVALLCWRAVSLDTQAALLDRLREVDNGIPPAISSMILGGE